MSAIEMDFYLVDPDQIPVAKSTTVVPQKTVVVKPVKMTLHRSKSIQTADAIVIVGCVLLLSTMFGVLTYLIISGESMMDDSRDLVMPVDVMAISRSTSIQGRCAKGACTLYVTTVRYTFNNQTKEEPYTSSTPYFTGNNFTITISKSLGIPLRFKDSELYQDGYARNIAGIIVLVGVLSLILGIFLSIACSKCSKNSSKKKRSFPPVTIW